MRKKLVKVLLVSIAFLIALWGILSFWASRRRDSTTGANHGRL